MPGEAGAPAGRRPPGRAGRSDLARALRPPAPAYDAPLLGAALPPDSPFVRALRRERRLRPLPRGVRRETCTRRAQRGRRQRDRPGGERVDARDRQRELELQRGRRRHGAASPQGASRVPGRGDIRRSDRPFGRLRLRPVVRRPEGPRRRHREQRGRDRRRPRRAGREPRGDRGAHVAADRLPSDRRHPRAALRDPAQPAPGRCGRPRRGEDAPLRARRSGLLRARAARLGLVLGEAAGGDRRRLRARVESRTGARAAGPARAAPGRGGLLRRERGGLRRRRGGFFAGFTETVRGQLYEANRAAGGLAVAVDAFLSGAPR